MGTIPRIERREERADGTAGAHASARVWNANQPTAADPAQFGARCVPNWIGGKFPYHGVTVPGTFLAAPLPNDAVTDLPAHSGHRRVDARTSLAASHAQD